MKQVLKSAEDVLERARENGAKYGAKRIAVAAAADKDVIEAVYEAQKENMVKGILVGDKPKILMLCEELQIPSSDLEIVDIPDEKGAAQEACRLADSEQAQIIMKGFLGTSLLLKTILSKKYDLRGTGTMSHCAVLGIPSYHKLLNITDGGIIPQPTIEERMAIIRNAVTVANALGVDKPKVAVISTVDGINQRFPSSKEAVEIIDRLDNELKQRITIEGPLSYEAAITGRCNGNQLDSQVAGDADILVVPTIEVCNTPTKAMVLYHDTVFHGVIVGSKVPVSLVSRTDSHRNKKASLAIAAVVAQYLKEQGVQ